MGLKSSVIAEKVGMPMKLYFYVDEIYCQLVFTA